MNTHDIDIEARGALTRQQIIDRFDFLEGIVSEHDFRRIYETVIEIVAMSERQAKGEPVAYLDLGVGGYTDVGTDLTDEQLAALPKGRHMLGIIGTYGVDGYREVAPQTQQIPEGFCLDAGHRAYKAKTGEDCTCPKYVRHPECDRHEGRKHLPSVNPWRAVPQPQEQVREPVAWWKIHEGKPSIVPGSTFLPDDAISCGWKPLGFLESQNVKSMYRRK